jgi:hypothetical protein
VKRRFSYAVVQSGEENQPPIQSYGLLCLWLASLATYRNGDVAMTGDPYHHRLRAD